MAVIKCKMCGGDLDISEGLSVCECEYCGTKQTVPSADNEKKLTLFARANRLRLANEFDKAAGVYESIVADYPEEAEAYWGLVLCRYGIEYVDDPATGKKVPTCHRVSFDGVLEDGDFDQACENADVIARRQYREEAKQIEDIRRGIIEVSGKEEPYDIFICYKETDENGDRTVDSVIAQDVYDALTEKGYRVFFSRISLEDKLGTEYEPYIFAALNSAKVMLAFGTDYEYYNAVWVKNEWSRFLKLMEKDKTKYLIPCYKGIDAYDMPKEFHRLQGQDMGKVGAVQDLLRGVEKLLPHKPQNVEQQPVVQQVIQSGGPNVTALLQRGNMALEDGEWNKAKEYFDQVLNMDAQCAEAYLGLALAETKLHNSEEIGKLTDRAQFNRLQKEANYIKALRFCNEGEKRRLQILCNNSLDRIAQADEQKRKAEAERVEREKREQAAKIKQFAAIRESNKRVSQSIVATWNRTVGLRADGTVAVVGNNDDGQWNIAEWRDIIAISIGKLGNYMVGLRADGTVAAVGNNEDGQCNVSEWRDIVAIAAGSKHTVGLRADGTVVAVGDNEDGQCSIAKWQDTVAITAGEYYTVGLRADGTVTAVGFNKAGQCDVAGWRNIVAITAVGGYTVGLRADGTVAAVGDNTDGQCDVAEWRDIVAIAAGWNHTVGLHADGTVTAVGNNEDGQCNVAEWQDIIAIAAGGNYTVGLRADGTATAVGDNPGGQYEVTEWREIVAIAAGDYHTIGLRADGTVVAVGDNEDGQCNVAEWKLFKSIDTLEQERQKAAERAERERRVETERIKDRQEQKQKELTEEQTRLNNELTNLKGLFSSKRRKEIEARLAEIDEELKKLQ